jgi:hypothetical protein
MFDNNKLKDLEKLMKGFPIGLQNKNLFDFSKIKKYLIMVILSLFFSGFGIGLLVGLLF